LNKSVCGTGSATDSSTRSDRSTDNSLRLETVPADRNDSRYRSDTVRRLPLGRRVRDHASRRFGSRPHNGSIAALANSIATERLHSG